MISLIAVANFFHTLSTNIALRKRDFAMLASIGITKKGIRNMLRYECILYGVRSLIFGIPIAFLGTRAAGCRRIFCNTGEIRTHCGYICICDCVFNSKVCGEKTSEGKSDRCAEGRKYLGITGKEIPCRPGG